MTIIFAFDGQTSALICIKIDDFMIIIIIVRLIYSQWSKIQSLRILRYATKKFPADHCDFRQ